MKRVKNLTHKSRTAILLFLSALTLTLVFYVSLPARPFVRHTNYKIEVQIANRKTAHQKTIQNTVATNSQRVISNNRQVLLTYAPWTAATSPRGPPV